MISKQLTTGDLARGIASHPLEPLRTIWAKRVDMLANLAPGGLLGIGCVALLPLMLVVLLANTLSSGDRFAEPLFQALPIYILLPVGTVAVLAWLARHHRRAARILAIALAVQTIGWAAVWGLRTPGQWLRIPAPVAATLARIEAQIPASAEVIASQGVVGRFSSRAHVHELAGPGSKAIDGGEIWFVIVPASGVELQSTASATTLIGELAGPLHATLVTHAHGVWAFRWRPPPWAHAIIVPAGSAPLPAWAAPGAAGRDVMSGPVIDWHVTSTGGRGYVADGLAWLRPPGRYRAFVTLSAAGPVNVEVWDDTGGRLLARRSIPATAGVESVALPVDAATSYRASAYSGWGPFRAEFVQPPPGQRLEVRVWSPGGGRVNVYSAELVVSG